MEEHDIVVIDSDGHLIESIPEMAEYMLLTSIADGMERDAGLEGLSCGPLPDCIAGGQVHIG